MQITWVCPNVAPPKEFHTRGLITSEPISIVAKLWLMRWGLVYKSVSNLVVHFLMPHWVKYDIFVQKIQLGWNITKMWILYQNIEITKKMLRIFEFSRQNYWGPSKLNFDFSCQNLDFWAQKFKSFIDFIHLKCVFLARKFKLVISQFFIKIEFIVNNCYLPQCVQYVEV